MIQAFMKRFQELGYLPERLLPPMFPMCQWDSPLEVNTAEEGTEAYEHYLVCSNKNGFDPDNDIEWEFSWRLHYEYDSEAQKTYLSIVPGEDVASYGPYTIRFRRLALDGSTSDVYRGEYDAETKTVTFENANLIGDMYKDGLDTNTEIQAIWL